jgi:N utilization substance protein B
MPIEEAITGFYHTLVTEEAPAWPDPDPFMETLSTGVVKNLQGVDDLISAKSENWRLDRMATVDRNILRLAVYEMMHVGTPGPVVIDEALELARQFSGEESVSFINGVLDAVHRAKTA